MKIYKHSKNINFRNTLAFIMAIVMMFTVFSSVSHLVSIADDGDKPYVMLDGERTTDVVLKEDAKLRLFAISTKEADGYSWQISHPEKDVWVDIDGTNSNKLWLTSALVSSMTNDSGQTRVRCAIISQGNEIYTDPVNVTLSYNTGSHETEATFSGRSSRKMMKSAKAATDEHITYSVIINYVFENNTIAFEPYGATIAAGSDFTDPIESPSVVGYDPFYLVGDQYVSAKFVYPEIYNIQQNVVINVIYRPAMVNFYIHHHKQDIYDDNYSVTPDKITEGTAPTGTKVGDGLAFTEEEWPGFKALAYERLEVAADSSTAIEIRYDRKYYLVDFDMNGGYGAEPIYTRYESTVGTNTPIRHGYIFDGWELVSFGDEAPTNAQKSKYDINGKTITVPAANLSYKAKWIVGETKYTMVFWCENPDDNGYSYWGSLENISAMSGDVVNARDLISQVSGIDDEAYFEFNSLQSDKNIIVEGDGSTVVNAYYNRKFYTITFKAAGLCAIEEKHQHTDDCYETICGLGHVHNSTCVSTLTCKLPEHTAHTDECIGCGKEPHVHGGQGCDCVKEQHQHSIDCWDYVGSETSKPSRAPDNPQNGQIYYRFSFFGTNYYIYLFGVWHYYDGEDVSSGMVLPPDCNKDEHTHGSDCSCTQEEHQHSETCYKDILHTHTEACYTYSCGQDEHIHTSACNRLICAQPTGHTHTSDCKNAKKSNTIKLVKEKYGHFIGDIWPIEDEKNNVVYDDGQRWTPSSSSFYSNVLVYISQMPPDDFTLTLSTSSADTYTMRYYLEVLEGESYKETYDNRKYILDKTIVANYNYITKEEDFFDIKGFYQHKSNPSFNSSNQIDITNGGEVKFYYNRIVDHVLEFSNNGEVIENKSVYGIPYGSLLTKYNFVPDYPSNLEPGAYEFDGWYTSPGCYDGTQVNWNSITMSEGDMKLYAKWIPTNHNVRVFLNAEKTVQIGETIIVPHGRFADEPKETISNEGLIFQGWFYMDGDVEKAFVFKGIPINEDIDVYAKWSSHVEVEYRVFYKLKGTDIDVADPIINTSIAGNNKTFEAKAGDKLYEPYRSGYYPDVNSHTVTMSVIGDHTFTFWYDYVESMPYKVRYVDEQGNDLIDPPKIVMDNRLSVVTETFVRIEEKMPDAYQKRLILTSSGEDSDNDGVLDNNVITFHYTSDKVHAYYRIVHYVENVERGTYYEYRSEEKVGVIGEQYTVKALTLTGFKYVKDKTDVTGDVPTMDNDTVTATLGKDGLLIRLYYDRTSVKYFVEYVDSENNLLVPEKQGEGLFGEQVLEYAPDLSEIGYTLVSENLKPLTLSATEELNVIKFVYEENTATIKYEIIGPANCGTLIPQTELLKAVSGVAKGSVPTAGEGFVFEGWYYDSYCTQRVDDSLIGADNRLIPKKQDGIWKDQTFYAKFNALETNLTLSVNGLSHLDTEQAFMFTIKGVAGTDTQDVNITVSITGNNSVNVSHIPVGRYTITYHNDWAWRFKRDDAVKEINLEYNNGTNHITYIVHRNNDSWLDGQHDINNIF